MAPRRRPREIGLIIMPPKPKAVSPQDIWQVPVYLPYLQPALTPAAIAAAEKHIGHKLPAAYRNLLRVQNGGYIRYQLPDLCHTLIYGIGPNYPSLTDFDWDADRDAVSFELDGLVPFDGDGHWHLCLDYRGKRKNPKVTYIDVECDRQTPIADSFAAYLALLTLEISKDDWVLSSPADIEDIKQRLSAALGLQFDPPSSFDHGYPIARADGGTAEAPECIWISPNLVPRGFARPSEAGYRKLRHLLPGTALRFPFLPDSSYILSITDGLKSRVLAACRRLRLDIRPLSEWHRVKV
jgi:hypothetical protein